MKFSLESGKYYFYLDRGDDMYCKKLLEELGFKFNLQDRCNHYNKSCYLKEPGYISINIDTLEELLELSKKFKEALIIDNRDKTIIIYNDY